MKYLEDRGLAPKHSESSLCLGANEALFYLMILFEKYFSNYNKKMGAQQTTCNSTKHAVAKFEDSLCLGAKSYCVYNDKLKKNLYCSKLFWNNTTGSKIVNVMTRNKQVGKWS